MVLTVSMDATVRVLRWQQRRIGTTMFFFVPYLAGMIGRRYFCHFSGCVVYFLLTLLTILLAIYLLVEP